jgi:FdhD protein
VVDLEVVYRVPRALRARQALFERTGGCHAAALFDERGEILVLGEDLGRHSALDKVLGHALRTGVPTQGEGVILSGRTSLEMIVKAARAGVGLVLAISAPSDAAVDAAARLGITLCGFARGDEVAVYTHERRLRVPVV